MLIYLFLFLPSACMRRIITVLCVAIYGVSWFPRTWLVQCTLKYGLCCIMLRLDYGGVSHTCPDDFPGVFETCSASHVVLPPPLTKSSRLGPGSSSWAWTVEMNSLPGGRDVLYCDPGKSRGKFGRGKANGITYAILNNTLQNFNSRLWRWVYKTSCSV